MEGASRMSSVLGLKVRPSTAIGAAADAAAAGRDHLARHGPLALVVDGRNRLQDAAGRAEIVRRLHQRGEVLGKARAAEARPGVQELAPDPVVEADAARHLLHVGAGPLAQVRHLVDEGDLGRQEGVGRVLDELRRAPAGEQQRRLVEIQRAVDVGHDLARALVVGADDDAVGPLEVADGRALAQELRVRHDGEARVRPRPRRGCARPRRPCRRAPSTWSRSPCSRSSSAAISRAA